MGEEGFIILGVIAGVLIIIILLGCISRKYCSEKSPSEDPDYHRVLQKDLVGQENLIPPIFYTEETEDPLSQEDMHNHVRVERIDVPKTFL